MLIAIIVAIGLLNTFLFGFFMGRCRAELEFEELRSQLEIDEDDPFSELFKE